MNLSFFRYLLPVLVIPFLAACVSETSPVTGEKTRYGFSWEEEKKLGGEADKDIVEEMGLYEGGDVQNYVKGIGQKVLERSDLRAATTAAEYRNTDFTIRVLNSPVVNAFALPGGYVYVTRGLLSHVQNEAQLAVVLGHEIGHVAARHSATQQKRGTAAQIGVMAAAILGSVLMPDNPDLVNTGMDLIGKGAQGFMMRYSREAEHEADSLGVKYASQAGYATSESAHFFESLKRIGEKEGQALPTWQSSHPDPGDRAQRVTQMSVVAPGASPLVGEEEFLRKIDGMIVGENPREGFEENGTFYHPELRFQFPVPTGWKLQNETSVVIMSAPNGGAMLGFQMAPGSSAQAAASDFAQKSGIQNAAASQTHINGMPAVAIIGQANTQQGAVGVWTIFIEMDRRVYNFMGYAPVQALAQYRRAFEGTAAGLTSVRDNRILNAQPSKLTILRTDRSARFAEFVPPNLPRGITPEGLAIMNQVQLNQVIPAGRLLKIPSTPR